MGAQCNSATRWMQCKPGANYDSTNGETENWRLETAIDGGAHKTEFDIMHIECKWVGEIYTNINNNNSNGNVMYSILCVIIFMIFV